MPSRLPSLNALRTFEAAARHESFTLAAEELSVTASAVGFQVKQLEDEIGEPLFVRKPRQLELTEKGRTLARELNPAFDTIAEAWNEIRSEKPAPKLRITAPQHAVSSFLLSAIRAAQEVKPGPSLSWEASPRKRSEGWDVAVRFAVEPIDGHFCEPILRPWWLPLARPEVARQIRKPNDLIKHGLIDVQFGLDTSDGYTAWPSFLKLLGLAEPEYAMTCIDTLTAMNLATETNLVAIGFPTESHLKAGSLVYPIKKAVLPLSRNWFVCPKGVENTEEILWLREAFHTGAEIVRQSFKDVEMFELDGSPARNST